MNPDLGYGNNPYGLGPGDHSSTTRPREYSANPNPHRRGEIDTNKTLDLPYSTLTNARRDVEKDSSAVYSPPYDQRFYSRSPNVLKKGTVHYGPKGSNWNPGQNGGATYETQQRLEQDLHELKELRKNQDQQIEDLKAILRENEDKFNKLKRRNEKLQAQIDNDESTLGRQQPDEVIVSQFRSLVVSIKNWASKWFSGSFPLDVGFDFDWSNDGDLKAIQSILPYVKNQEDFENFSTDVRKRRGFVRGWIGLHVAKDIFRTLPAAVNLYPFAQELGSDIWIPSKLRSHVDNIELVLLNSGDSATLNEFNQWRSLTMSLLFKKYPGVSEETTHLLEESARQALRPILSVVPIADMEHAKQQLIENVYKPALELSQLLRRQRALWSVRFPYANSQSRNGSTTPVFNEVFMKDTDDIEDEDEPGGHDVRTPKWVDIVVAPLLYKSGTIDGKQYDVENVVERAEVFCIPSNPQYCRLIQTTNL